MAMCKLARSRSARATRTALSLGNGAAASIRAAILATIDTAPQRISMLPVHITARDVAALKAANACPATGSALNEFEANRCRGEFFQFGALFGRQSHFLAFSLGVDGDANAIMVSLRIASDRTGMSSCWRRQSSTAFRYSVDTRNCTVAVFGSLVGRTTCVIPDL
jgi:hypothetical protein